MVMYGVAIIGLLTLVAVTHAIVDIKVGMIYEAKLPAAAINKFYLFPAAQIAFEEVAERLANGDYKNFNMSYVSTNSCCTRPVRSSGALASSFYHEDGVDAYLGPAISADMISVADMAAYWNLPVISGASTSTLLDDKTRFPTLTRTSPAIKLVAQLVSALFQHSGFQQCTLLRGFPDDSTYYSEILPDAIFEALEANGLTVIEVFADQYESLDAAIQKAASLSDIVFISNRTVREAMVVAHRLGYTSGSHKFLHWCPFEYSPWQASFQFDDLNPEVRAALRALVIMRYQVPDNAEYHEFQETLRARQLALYGNAETEDNLYAAAWHDAVMIYAQVINETVGEGGNVRDGRAITRKMWNRTFQGTTGPVYINENGDRYGVCELLQMEDSANGTFSVIGTYDEASNTMHVGDITWHGKTYKPSH